MIQKGYITDGVVQKPNINYIELQICRIKGTEVLTGQPELQDLPKMENTKTCSYGATTLGPSENVTGLDFDWNTLPKDSHNGKEWKNSILNNHQTNLGTNADDTTHTQIPFGINLESGQKFQNDAQKRKSSAVGKEKEETSKLGEDKTKLFHQYTSDDKGKMIMNKHSLLESLFDSYHCIQQTLMSHIMSAKAEDEKDEVVDDLRYAFIELNNDANDIMLK
ncbi:uncharacterized protein LOC108198366 isoform X3 [Daucus carota subsp. sativus]|uniref:uncharacterized protein LOC108198366 isoform X3 n=1 Tax=Daucus carota subsp. sativus TaxID=79200 RepID=UPI0007EFCD14|nr:PREDICTED: uncharacterized protein LOC108198366 isoform X2 [Daucus carota subsp. sativus]